MSRDGDNRRIAEWLEPRPTELNPHGITLVGWHSEVIGSGRILSPLRAWHRGQDYDISWQPRDFYTDEATNAMLLDALLARYYKITDRPSDFMWAWNQVAELIMEQIRWRQNNDRKTAIVNAALKLIEKAKR